MLNCCYMEVSKQCYRYAFFCLSFLHHECIYLQSDVVQIIQSLCHVYLLSSVICVHLLLSIVFVFVSLNQGLVLRAITSTDVLLILWCTNIFVVSNALVLTHFAGEMPARPNCKRQSTSRAPAEVAHEKPCLLLALSLFAGLRQTAEDLSWYQTHHS